MANMEARNSNRAHASRYAVSLGLTSWKGSRSVSSSQLLAVREHRRSIDLVRYRLFGSDLHGLETVASVSGGIQVGRRTQRQAVAQGSGRRRGARP
jgi:hypothetical protein